MKTKKDERKGALPVGDARSMKKRAMETVDIDVLSLCGPVRQENQDAALAWFDRQQHAFVVVSDGMGGHTGGREAAELVVRACAEATRQPSNGVALPAVLKDAILAAHREVVAARSETATMGATVVLGAVDLTTSPLHLHLAHVGDSRAYLCRGQSVYRLTADHSLVGQMVSDGFLTEDEAFGHPDGNILQQAIGQSKPIEPEVQKPLPLDAGDTLILCSDGLHGVVTDAEIQRTVHGAATAQQACQALLRQALDAGSEDNISIVCVKVPRKEQPLRPTRPQEAVQQPA